MSARRSRNAAAFILVPLLAGCGPTITAPDVVGMRLDAAHREFEALEVDKFEDVDVIGEEETPLWDGNWVVVAQDPAAGTKEVDTGTKIRLEVGHEDDDEVLEMIPSDSPFAKEMTKKTSPKPKEEEKGSANKSTSPTPSPSETGPTGEPESTITPEDRAASVACARRDGNPGEIYVWNSYNGEQPADAIRLGAGFVWLWGDKECVTSHEFALRINPRLPGYCTQVGKVSANPGYDPDRRPAPRLQSVIGQSGDC